MTDDRRDYLANDLKDKFFEDLEGRQCVAGLLGSSVGFYIGDICYVLDSELYDDFWGAKNYKDGVYLGKDVEFAVARTAFGDGEYYDQYGNVYGVDAGVIGIVPYETLVAHGRFDRGHLDSENIIESANGLGHFFEGKVAQFIAEDGQFEIVISGLPVDIDTRDGAW